MPVSHRNITTISVDYLRCLTEEFERSRAEGRFTTSKWTKALEEEHCYTVKKIHDSLHDSQASSSLRLRHDTSGECTNETDQQDLHRLLYRYGHRPLYQTPREPLHVHTCYAHYSTTRYDKNGNKFTNEKNAVIRKKAECCRFVATKFDDVVIRVINILRQPSGQFPLMEDLAAQSLLDSLQALIDHPDLEKTFKGTILSVLLKVPRRSNFYPSNFSFDHIGLDGQLPVTSGGFADIYKAWWPHDDRAVCLKVYRKVGTPVGIKAGLHQIVNREAFIWRHLSHENVVPFYGIHPFGDSRIALVSPWIKHGHIHHFLALNPEADRSLLILDVASGLSYLHQNNIIHGDLKGTNILVTDTHRACLSDFGLSSITDIRGFTTVGGGAIRWLAPELLGEVEVPKTRASDVYAFAMSCYEIFTGNKPYPEVIRDLTVITKVLAGERLSRPSHSVGLDDEMWFLMEECWLYDAYHRLTAVQIVQRLIIRIGDRKRRPSSEDILIREFMSSSGLTNGAGPSSAETLMALENIIQELILLKEQTQIQKPHPRSATAPSPSTHQPQTGLGNPFFECDVDNTSVDKHFEDVTLGLSTDQERENVFGYEGNLVGGSQVSTVISKLEGIFENVEQYKLFLNCERSAPQSQSLLDLFQQLLQVPTLETRFRHNLIIATQRLAKTTNLYPNCFVLENVGLIDDEPIAAGGFADIHKGCINNRVVCLKVIRLYQVSQVDYIIKRFYEEAILWGQLSHQNLLPFYGLYRFRGRLCLVSPWVENGDINKYLERNPRVNRVLLALDVATGVSYLHANGIIHGDLKGPNILVDDAGRGRLADFGLSAVTDPCILKWTSQSSAASKGGSVRWQAPELFGAESDELVPNSKASDVYAWGCVCYEIFTGTVPFFEFSRDSTVMLKVGLGKRPSCPPKTSPPWMSWGLTTDIWSLQQDCWREDPTQRPSADEIIAQLSYPLGGDARPTGSWGGSLPVHFSHVGRRYPSIGTLETMLWGVVAPDSSA